MASPNTLMVERVLERACRLSNGTSWPLPERDDHDNRAAHVARYNPSRLTRDQAMYLATIADAYEALIGNTADRAAKTLAALRMAVGMRALGEDKTHRST